MQSSVRNYIDLCLIGDNDELAELEVVEQIAEARYEAYRDNYLPGLQEKEIELLNVRQRIAALREGRSRKEGELLCTVHEVESADEYDRCVWRGV